MLDHLAVTTFSKEGYRLYGRRFIDSFMAQWDIPLAVFYEDKDAPPAHPRMLRFDLDEDVDRANFIAWWNGPQWNADWQQPNSQAVRFCHKVFAITSPRLPASRWRIWLDADVEWKAPVNEDALRDLCPEDCSLSFLGRTSPPYSECGFVGYKTEDSRVVAMLADMRKVYTSGELFKRPRNCWHDSATFDYCRERSGIPKQQQHDLNRKKLKPGMFDRDPWSRSVLARLGVHWKGLRKDRAYGGHCSNGGP